MLLLAGLGLVQPAVQAQQNVWNPDNGDGTFTNPLLWGDWPDPDVIRVGDLFDDDGRVFVVHGQGTLYVTELTADARAVKSEPRQIWSGGFKNAHELGGGFGMEGAHAYKINGKYYITCPAGGTEGWQICLRSDDIYGPYEHHLIMNDSISYPPNGLHQGGMVQLKNGDWWFVIMQDRGPIGRVPNLVPVTWKDGWPILGHEGKDAVTYVKPEVGKRSRVISQPLRRELTEWQTSTGSVSRINNWCVQVKNE